MQTQDRVKKLSKAVDDMYANVYLWHQLDNGHLEKMKVLFKRMENQLGISDLEVRNQNRKKYTEDF